ncbi:hypothetical protein Q8A67_002888 [Cirrhinus molitorella]|uniref:Uncharacterized protein n=1 Tax=Cirrhinus molitorella TaxID=172907 RepID=A0AA88QIR6_9TELE|nr:hypothetical protein Q8A67_002888 [Cirrhinus molitorella]
MQVLWHFRKDLRCARVIDSDLDTKELSKQVVDLFLLSNEEQGQVTETVGEFYLLIFLLFWPDEAQPAIANPPNLEKCVQYMSQSYETTYQKYLRCRYLVPLFFLGKGKGVQRLIHTSKLHQIDWELLTEGDENAEVECLQRVNGNVEDNNVLVVRDGQQIQVTPHNWVTVNKQGQVSFYLGFNIKGPVACNIRYEENCK